MAKKMTEEEADALDELWTHNPPPFKSGVGGPFTRQREELLAGLAPENAAYVRTQARTTHRSPIEIVNDLVRQAISAAATA